MIYRRVAAQTGRLQETLQEMRMDRLTFRVRDNGIGIAPEHQGRIFGIFQRLSAGYQGTGIGLALVRKAVDRMGGTVKVESVVDHGSTFSIELPAA